MIELVTNQPEADLAFKRWIDALLAGSTPSDSGWIIESRNVVFTNYGHGAPGELENEVMLGTDPTYTNGAVKIVRPNTAQLDKGKLTAIGRDSAGTLLLLRQGWLRPNRVSREVRADFAQLSGLTSVEVAVGAASSSRQWYVVADLGASPAAMLAQTADFALACVHARNRAGGGSVVNPIADDSASPPIPDEKPTALALDESGKIFVITRTAASVEVVALQGYVYQALKTIIGDELTKPTKAGFAVDGVIAPAGLLLEIKTGSSAHEIYEAVGQLTLYPALVGLNARLAPVLLIPRNPPLKPIFAAALADAGIEVYTYAVTTGSAAPTIKFSRAFLKRCGVEY